jgi:hypothetical protein
MDGSLGPFLPATSFDLICTSAAFISVLSDGTESTGALFCYMLALLFFLKGIMLSLPFWGLLGLVDRQYIVTQSCLEA